MHLRLGEHVLLRTSGTNDWFCCQFCGPRFSRVRCWLRLLELLLLLRIELYRSLFFLLHLDSLQLTIVVSKVRLEHWTFVWAADPTTRNKRRRSRSWRNRVDSTC